MGGGTREEDAEALNSCRASGRECVGRGLKFGVAEVRARLGTVLASQVAILCDVKSSYFETRRSSD